MRALGIVVCAVVVMGCSSSRHLRALHEGAAGMGAEPAERIETVEAVETAEPGCESLSKLVASDGTIEFLGDGNALISVWLENTSDDDVLDYPGLNVFWTIENRYAGGSGELLLYGLLAHDRHEYIMMAPAEMTVRGIGSTLIVHAQPFTIGARDSELGCEAISLEFSSPVL